MGTTTTSEINIDETTFIDAQNISVVQNGNELEVQGKTNYDKHTLIKIPIPTRRSLSIPDDAIIDSLNIDLWMITTGSNRDLQLYTTGQDNRWEENEVTFNSPYGGAKALWTPAWDATSPFYQTFCSETATGTSAAWITWTVPYDAIQKDSIDFNGTYYFALMADATGQSTALQFEDDSNAGSTGNLPRYSITWTQPEPAPPKITATPDGENVIINNGTTFDQNYSAYTLNWSTSATIAASSTHQATLTDTAWTTFNSNGLAQIGGNDVLATEDSAYYLRAFVENTSHTDAEAIGSNTLKIVRPKVTSVAISTAFTNTGDEGALTITAASSVHSGLFKKVHVIWDGASSGETYTSDGLATITLTNSASSTIIKHIFGNSGAKKIWVGIEDEDGYRSDLKLITSISGISDPNPSARSATAVPQAAKKTMSLTEYGLLDDANVVNSVRSVTGDSGEQIYHHKWQHGVAYADALVTSFATDIDNTELESGSKQLAVKQSRSRSSTRITVFGLASFYDNNGTETVIADTHASFSANNGYYRYVSEELAPEVLYANTWADDSPTGSTNYFKHVDMCVITTSAGGSESNSSPTRFMVGRKDHVEGANRLIAPYLSQTISSDAWGGYKTFNGSGGYHMVLDKSNNDIEWTDSGDAYFRRDALLEVGDKIYVEFGAAADSSTPNSANTGYYTIKAITGGSGDLGNKIEFEETVTGSGTSAATVVNITRDTREAAAVPFVMYSSSSPSASEATIISGVSQDRLGSTTASHTMKIKYQKPKSIDIDELIANNHLTVENSSLSRSGGLEGRVPIGQQIYPVGVIRTNSGMPTLNVTLKALSQTGLRALWNMLEANRYDYVFINSKRIDTPTTAHRTLIVKPINGKIDKSGSDGKYYSVSMTFMALGEKRDIA